MSDQSDSQPCTSSDLIPQNVGISWWRQSVPCLIYRADNGYFVSSERRHITKGIWGGGMGRRDGSHT